MYLDSEFMTSWIVIALCLWINTFYFICRSQIVKILSIWCCKIVKTWWKPDKHFFFWWSKKWMTSLVMLFMVSPWLLTLTWTLIDLILTFSWPSADNADYDPIKDKGFLNRQLILDEQWNEWLESDYQKWTWLTNIISRVTPRRISFWPRAASSMHHHYGKK